MAPFVTLAAVVAGCGGAPASGESTQPVNAQTASEAPAPRASNTAPTPAEVSAPSAPSEPCRVVVSAATVSFGTVNGMTLGELRTGALRFAAEHQGDVGGPSCVIAPAPETAYARMIEVMDVLIQAGIPNISLEVISEDL